MDGVDGIKTGYIRSSGFNLVTNLKRGNRHLVGVVLGGRSSGSRDATMRSLLAENLDKAATRRTVAAITESSTSDANAKVAEDQARSQPQGMVQVDGAVQVASALTEAGRVAARTSRSSGPLADNGLDRRAAAETAKPEPAALPVASSRPSRSPPFPAPPNR